MNSRIGFFCGWSCGSWRRYGAIGRSCWPAVIYRFAGVIGPAHLATMLADRADDLAEQHLRADHGGD